MKCIMKLDIMTLDPSNAAPADVQGRFQLEINQLQSDGTFIDISDRWLTFINAISILLIIPSCGNLVLNCWSFSEVFCSYFVKNLKKKV